MTKKSKVLERKAFQDKDADVENVGIMQGFIDMLTSEEDEPEDEQDMAVAMGRTPDNPEILMNTLSGEMRSVDARREELADQVGYAAAMETPDSVLALLQIKQESEGIGGLPQNVSPMIPPGNPPMMPPMASPPPGGIASLPTNQGPGPQPVRMKDGGIVHMSNGGLTLDAIMAQKKRDVPTFESALASSIETLENLPGFQSDTNTRLGYLGLAQNLFDFSQSGDTKKLISDALKTGSQVQALKERDKKGLTKAAIPLATASREAIMDYNQRLAESQEKIALKRLEISGKGITEGTANRIIARDFEKYINGELEGEALNSFEIAVGILNRPKYTSVLDRNTGEMVQRREPSQLDILIQTSPKYEILKNKIESKPIVSSNQNEDLYDYDNYDEDLIFAEDPGYLPGSEGVDVELNYSLVSEPGPYTGYGGLSTQENEIVNTLWEISPHATGPKNIVFGDYLTKVPIIGDFFADAYGKENQSISALRTAKNAIAGSLRQGDKFTVGEQARILEELQLDPAFWDSVTALQNRLISVDNSMMSRIKKEESILNNKEISAKQKNLAQERTLILKSIRKTLGIPTRVPLYRTQDGKVDKERIRASLNELFKQNGNKRFQYIIRNPSGKYVSKIYTGPRK